MAVIVRFKDPSNLKDRETIYPIVGKTLADAFEANFEHDFGGLSTDVYINGEKYFSTDDGSESGDLNVLLLRVVEQGDRIAVINRPAGVELVVIAVIAIIAIAAVVLLAPTVAPGTSENAGSSPNSNLNAATNEFRPNEGIPEIFGSPTSYPDFVQPSYYIYENNLKIQRELFCFGVGEYEVGDVRSGETLIDSIPNSFYELYGPDDTVPSEYQITVRETNEITSQSLEAIDSESLTASFEGFDSAVIAVGTNTKIIIGEDPILDLALVVGDYVRLDIEEAPTGTQTWSGLLAGDFEITEVNQFSIVVATPSGVSAQADHNVRGDVTRLNSDGEIDNWVGWYTVTGDAVEQVWFHVVLPQGLRTEKGKQATIDLTMQVVEIDSSGNQIGTVIQQSATITETTLDAQYRTYYFTGLTPGRYQGRIRRLTAEYEGAASDLVQLEQLVSVTPQSTPNYGNVTLMWVERKANERLVGGSQSKINADLTRKLPYYNRTTGLLETNNLVATRDFADAIAYTLIVAAKRDETTVDLDALYEINDALDEELRRFDFTFDDGNVGLRERLTVIANVARVIAYQSYRNWSFTRVESKAAHTMLFNRRNTVGDSSQAFPMWLPSNKDSVSLTYVSQPDNVETVIYRSIVDGVITEDEGLYPEEIELVGCQTESQAENRADYEIRRILYQRNSVTFDTYYFGLSAQIGDRVRWVDMNDQDVFGGEIMYITGDDFLTSEPIYFEDGKTYYVQITNEDGSISPLVTCTALSYTDKGFNASGLEGYTSSDGDYEFGSKYAIAADDELSGTDYTLKSTENSGDGLVTLTLSEYNEKLFEQD